MTSEFDRPGWLESFGPLIFPLNKKRCELANPAIFQLSLFFMRTLYDVGSKPSQEEEGEEEMDDNLLPPTETTFFLSMPIFLFSFYMKGE